MRANMRIELWADITCPYCYVGRYYLLKAIEKSSFGEDVEITWCSLELDPDTKKNPDGDLYELFASKYHQSRDWAIKTIGELISRTKKIGLMLNSEKIIPTNSFDAHRLIKLATNFGLANKAQERLFTAYFVEGKHISKTEILKQIGDEIGLDKEAVDELFAGDMFVEEVRADEWEAKNMGIQGVPYFLFERKYAISGAQPEEIFLEVLRKISKKAYV